MNRMPVPSSRECSSTGSLARLAVALIVVGGTGWQSSDLGSVPIKIPLRVMLRPTKGAPSA